MDNGQLENMKATGKTIRTPNMIFKALQAPVPD